MKSSISTKRQGMWGWLLQRSTAVLLLFALGSHLWALHLAEQGRKIDFQKVSQRLQSPFFQVLDIILIGLVLYHGIYGLRGILFDLVSRPGTRSVITWGLTLLGLAAFLLAIGTILVFLGG